eukprot:3861842-Amphidinium_carterae.1
MADVPPSSGPCHMAGIGRRALQRSLFSLLRHSEKPTQRHTLRSPPPHLLQWAVSYTHLRAHETEADL